MMKTVLVANPRHAAAVQCRIRVTDRKGIEHDIEWEPKQSLMEALRNNGMPVLASCGGKAACATCHVYLDPDLVARLGQRSSDEQELVEEARAYDAARSRLACQVMQDVSLDGVLVELAPEDG
jgi:2Fe-2S ferredoxin